MDRMIDCDFELGAEGWSCEGNGNLLGERSYGHGPTKAAAYDDYRARVRRELADMIDEDADEAELIQDEMDEAGEDRSGDEPIGTSLRDHLAATADVDAMRERASDLRRAAEGGAA